MFCMICILSSMVFMFWSCNEFPLPVTRGGSFVYEFIKLCLFLPVNPGLLSNWIVFVILPIVLLVILLQLVTLFVIIYSSSKRYNSLAWISRATDYDLSLCTLFDQSLTLAFSFAISILRLAFLVIASVRYNLLYSLFIRSPALFYFVYIRPFSNDGLPNMWLSFLRIHSGSCFSIGMSALVQLVFLLWTFGVFHLMLKFSRSAIFESTR